MNIAFTICSNNYLAHAKTLGDSFLEHHPDFSFLIGLVDKYSDELDYSVFKNFTIIPVAQLNIPSFKELNEKFTITELNTAVKPSYFDYIFKKYHAQKIIYIDPDILVTSRFEEVINSLDTKNIIITPHIFTPVDDEHTPTDYQTLRGGVFNLGFIALSNYNSVMNFLNWWHERVIKYGYGDHASNMFYDQLWINYVPAFYENYLILKHPGYNMAHWNLHERYLSKDESEKYRVNSNYHLRFFHFSGYKITSPDVICSYASRYTFDKRPDLSELFKTYYALLKRNKVDEIRKLGIYYYPHSDKLKLSLKMDKPPVLKRITSRLKRSVRVLIYGHY